MYFLKQNHGRKLHCRPETTPLFILSLFQPPLSVAKIAKLKDVYKLDEVNNSEIKFRWLRLGLKAHYSDAIPPAIEFVTEQGRMKFVRPIYR
jgi:leukotriene-A4 hydrolase